MLEKLSAKAADRGFICLNSHASPRPTTPRRVSARLRCALNEQLIPSPADPQSLPEPGLHDGQRAIWLGRQLHRDFVARTHLAVCQNNSHDAGLADEIAMLVPPQGRGHRRSADTAIATSRHGTICLL